jgi:hypothetical protein
MACYVFDNGCKDGVWNTVLSPTCWIVSCSTPFFIRRPLDHHPFCLIRLEVVI